MCIDVTKNGDINKYVTSRPVPAKLFFLKWEILETNDE